MPGSNPSKYNNDQTGRAAANYGFEHLRQLSADNQRHQDTTGFTGVTQSRNIGNNTCPKIRILKFQSNSVLEYYSLNLFALIQQSTKLNCFTNSAVQQLYRLQKHNACLLLPVTSLHYKQIKQKQTGFESRYNATKKKGFLNSLINKIMNVNFLQDVKFGFSGNLSHLLSLKTANVG